jgi:predicted Zn finger-like uncharacterized protein
MRLSTECPFCQARVTVSDTAVGRSVRCPACKDVFEVEGAAPSAAIAAGRAERPGPDEPSDDRPPRRAPAAARRSLGLTLAVLAGLGMSALALVLSGVALGLVFFRNPLPGSSLKKYDFSTPKAALTSQLEMERDQNLRAGMEMNGLVEGPLVQEKLRTLDVRKEAEWKGKKILFVAYEQKGVKKYNTIGFEKDAKTGFWLRHYVSSFEVRKDDERLARVMESWQDRGELNPPPRKR